MLTATITEFLRTPKAVIARADAGAIRITRRDAADLVVLRADDLEQEHEGIRLASQVMRAALRHEGNIRAGLTEQFPWTALLSEAELGGYVADMERHVWSAAELGEYAQLLREHHRWLETAEAYAAGLPRGDGAELTWIGDTAMVERPTGENAER